MSESQDAEKKKLLIVDDDERFAERLSRAMDRRGFESVIANSVADGIRLGHSEAQEYAVVDLRLQDGSGLDVVKAIHETSKDARVVVLTGYGNIATAVAAVKVGALDYLPKPADPDQVAATLLQSGADGDMPPPPELPMTADRVRWEHIQRVYEQCDRNVSETARRLRMHRRTLQRILAKYAPHA
ncbi:ActR/PrrA/RegA family redox response regulator transcription factor [Kiloniella majae]|uniref:ActR/PrrA/RegA family redox response regulator transcription factor n=1 Tax=Kiloniella majae TaxID=1938558 RepID=UPI00117A754B|nr:ActR/PrrA/RegA family redox response regulator transcription factor [Kiloniella majae]